MSKPPVKKASNVDLIIGIICTIGILIAMGCMIALFVTLP